MSPAPVLTAAWSTDNHSCDLMVMSVPPSYRVGIVSSASGRS
ncbi:hypothetical protein ACFXPV_35330 [Streptomyces sp. NPDC059118]